MQAKELSRFDEQVLQLLSYVQQCLSLWCCCIVGLRGLHLELDGVLQEVRCRAAQVVIASRSGLSG